jgi:UDP-glucose 4-epimerase
LGSWPTTTPPNVFNLGNGQGVTVLEIIEAARRVAGAKIASERIPWRVAAPVLVASSTEARDLPGWTSVFTDMESIIDSA